MSGDTVSATYVVVTDRSPEVVADAIAGEQSSGTFISVPGETPELRERAGARVRDISGVQDFPVERALPNRRQRNEKLRQFRCTIDYPVANFGSNVPVLATTVAGNLFELDCVYGLRLVSMTLPASLAGAFGRPRYGIPGTRGLVDVPHRPLLGTIIKPSVGLSPRETAEIARDLALAGIDFIKDDELQGDGPHCTFEDRFRAVSDSLDQVAELTGRRVLYAANATADAETMLSRAETLAGRPGSALMANVNYVGLSTLRSLADNFDVPIHAHRAGWGMMNRSPELGMDFQPYQVLLRLAGIDHLHTGGLMSKFWETDDAVATSVRHCLSSNFGLTPILPVLSSGQTPATVRPTVLACQSQDVLILAGGGILGHPGGLTAGVAEFHEAFEDLNQLSTAPGSLSGSTTRHRGVNGE